MTHNAEGIQFHPRAVEDPALQALLDEYFEARRTGFASSMGTYVRTDPEPADFENPRGVFLLVTGAIAPGTPESIGCGGIRLISHTPGVTRFEVKHLWIQPHARGLGIGRLLLAELESRALAFGSSELVLDTNASQVEAAALYRSAGYVSIAPYNDNVNATHWFAKNLSTELE